MGTIYRNGKFYGGFKEDQTAPINAEENEILIGDGNNWVKGSNIKTSTVEYLDYAASFDEVNPFTEFRIGPDVINENSEVSPVATVITNSPCYQKDISSNPLNLPKKASTNQYTLAEKAHRLLIKDTADISFRGNSYVDVQDNARFTMNQDAKLDVTGNKAQNLSPQVFIHDNSKVYIEAAPSANLDNYYSPVLHMHGDSRFLMESTSFDSTVMPSVVQFAGCYIHIGKGSKYKSEWANGQHSYRISSSQYQTDEGLNSGVSGRACGPVMHLTGHPVFEMTETAALALRQSSLIKMDDYSLIEMHGDQGSNDVPFGPHFEMGNTSFLALKTQYDRSPYVTFEGPTRFLMTSDTSTYGPSVRIGNKQILIHSNLEGAGSSTAEVDSSRKVVMGDQSALYSNYNRGLGEDWYTPTGTDFVTVDIENKSRVVIGGYDSAVVDIKIGSNSSSWPPSKEYFKTILGGNAFIQTSGNPHIEMHNGTTFISRGPLLNGKRPWEDYYMDSKGNSLNKLWSTKTQEFITDVELGQRPIKPNVSNQITDERGPLVGLYDEPIVHIHGKWDMSEPDYMEIPPFTVSIDAVIDGVYVGYPSTMAQMRTNPLYIKKCERLGYTEENQFNDENATFEVTYSASSYKEYRITGAKWIQKFRKKPEGWKDKPDKVADNPYIEIIDNAEIHMSGSGAITINDEGVTFGNASGSVTFSIEELTALKNLLNS